MFESELTCDYSAYQPCLSLTFQDFQPFLRIHLAAFRLVHICIMYPNQVRGSESTWEKKNFSHNSLDNASFPSISPIWKLHSLWMVWAEPTLYQGMANNWSRGSVSIELGGLPVWINWKKKCSHTWKKISHWFIVTVVLIDTFNNFFSLNILLKFLAFHSSDFTTHLCVFHVTSKWRQYDFR